MAAAVLSESRWFLTVLAENEPEWQLVNDEAIFVSLTTTKLNHRYLPITANSIDVIEKHNVSSDWVPVASFPAAAGFQPAPYLRLDSSQQM